MFPKGNNKRFSEWAATANLSVVNDHDRAAAMWAAENTDLMYEIMEENPRIKTVRGARVIVKSDALRSRIKCQTPIYFPI